MVENCITMVTIERKGKEDKMIKKTNRKTDKITFNNNSGYKTQYIIDEANKKVTCYMETDLETVFKKLYKMMHNRDHEGSYSFVRARLRYGKKNILYGVGVAQYRRKSC